MKKILGYAIMSVFAIIIVWGVFWFGPGRILIPASISSVFGFIILGGIWLIRYSKGVEK